MNATNQGTGFFWNTKSTQRTDIINYAGSNGAGGFDFWTVNASIPPKNIASISNSGDISCNTLTATNVYNKTYIDASINEILTSITTANGNFSNYYNKTYIDASFAAVDANYYKKTYIDSSFGEVYTKTDISSNYYTKNQSDGNYYNKTYIDSSFNSVYTKNQSDGNY